MVVLKCDVKHQSKDIKKRLANRMDAWDAGKYSMLIQETERDKKISLNQAERDNTRAVCQDLQLEDLGTLHWTTLVI
jgi:hypothetical protein